MHESSHNSDPSHSAPMCLPLAEAADIVRVGGKAASLDELTRAGLPVPSGFVITTAAFHAGRTDCQSVPRNGDDEIPPELAQQIAAHYQMMGQGLVAVRSSATAEDLAEASLAGQCETFLNVEGEEQLMAAVRRCWASLDSDRVQTYLQQHGNETAQVEMAVIVQRLVSADVAGVLFTANPQTGNANEMIVEASWGLGETVVAGRVQPDVIRFDPATGKVLESRIADKHVCLHAGEPELKPVEDEKRRAPCLKATDLRKLAQLGSRAANHFGTPQDIEWALADGELFLLQSRPITTLKNAAARLSVVDEIKSRLKDELAAGHGPWVRHNLGETIPHPTPLTWSVIRRFMSGSGGFGEMYRQIGFQPSPRVCEHGFLETIGGRIYMDLSAAPEMFAKGWPHRYDVELLHRDPDAAGKPPTEVAWLSRAEQNAGTDARLRRAKLRNRIKAARLMAKAAARVRALADEGHSSPTREHETIPQFVAWSGEEKQRALHQLSAEEWSECWRQREQRVLDEFAPHVLLPTLIADHAREELQQFLDEHFWDDDPRELANAICCSDAPDTTIKSTAAMREIGRGTLDAAEWLADFGHRGPDEFELAARRWRERSDELHAMATRLADGPDPLELHRTRRQRAEEFTADLRSRLPAGERKRFDRFVGRAERFLHFREDGKHYLLLGYDLLRDLAIEAGRRLDIGADVFLLTLEEVRQALETGFAPLELIEARRVERSVESGLDLPRVIDQEAVDLSDGLPIRPACDPDVDDGSPRGFPISVGKAQGPVRIVHAPEDAADLGEGYALVAPSTDPAWTPLFVGAAALVLERGGTLSHGAVVAREMGIPAVVLEDATRLFKDGEIIEVNGHNGEVQRKSDCQSDQTERDNREDERTDWQSVPRNATPPIVGRKEHLSWKIGLCAAAIWTLYLLALFLLPESWLKRPSFRLIDWFLWDVIPIFNQWTPGVGMPITVAVVALLFAMLTMVLQRFLTDCDRLAEAKRRAARLKRDLADLAKNDPQRLEKAKLSAPVQWRLLAGALVPLGLVLGPMVMTFCWMPERVAPAAWNGEPGSPVTITATVDADLREPVVLDLPPPLVLDDGWDAEQTVPPIRETLENLYARWLQSGEDPASDPLSLEELTVRQSRSAILDDLRQYLDGDIEPQQISWIVRTQKPISGRWLVTVRSGDSTLRANVVLGDRYPPDAEQVFGDSKSPVKSVQVRYTKPRQKQIFWAPFHFAGWDWDAGWLLVYLLAYLPAMFVFRWLLRIP